MRPPLWEASHTIPISLGILMGSYGSGMGIVWEAYHKGVPLLRVPGITLDLGLVFGWSEGYAKIRKSWTHIFVPRRWEPKPLIEIYEA